MADNNFFFKVLAELSDTEYFILLFFSTMKIPLFFLFFFKPCLTWHHFFLVAYFNYECELFQVLSAVVRMHTLAAMRTQTLCAIHHSSYWRNCATLMTDLSMESLFVMGNGSAVNEHIRKGQELSKPNLISI